MTWKLVDTDYYQHKDGRYIASVYPHAFGGWNSVVVIQRKHNDSFIYMKQGIASKDEAQSYALEAIAFRKEQNRKVKRHAN